ncbi:MAG: dienelactone hydrolase family protein [Polyangiales bacterium]
MGATVLVSDHDPFNLRLLHDACESAGYDVLTAAEGAEVLSLMARQSPDIVLLDSKIENMNALEVLKILKNDDDLGDIPIVMITDRDDSGLQRLALENGAQDFITRPYRVFEVQHRIRNVLRAVRPSMSSGAETMPPADQIDPATGAGTPIQMGVSIEYEHTRATRYGHPLTCLVVRVRNGRELAQLSIDKRADRAMSLIGAGIRDCIRQVDQLYRVRRDEFGVLLPETDAENAMVVFQRLSDRVASGELWGNDVQPPPEISMSMASAPNDAIKSGQHLLDAARAGLNRPRLCGKCSVLIYNLRMTIHTETFEYSDGSTKLLGYCSERSGETEKRSAVLVVHEWWGCNEFAKKRAEMVAELGYVALAVDMFGDRKTADNPADANDLMNSVLSDPSVAFNRFNAALNAVRGFENVDANNIAAIGFCFGGAVVLHMARAGLPLKAIASFHGILGTETPAKPGAIKGRVGVFTGADDPMAGPDQVQAFEKEMNAAGVDYELVSYPGVKHGFTNPLATQRGIKYQMPLAYDEHADKDSWSRLITLLADVFK